MAEVVYKLTFFMMLVIFFSALFFIKMKLDYWKQFHWLDFVSIDKDFQISTWNYNYFTRNIIYTEKYPNECKNWNKNSLRCLAALKHQVGVYNGLIFFSWTNMYR